MYPEELVKPMRQELVSAGFQELYSAKDVEEALQKDAPPVPQDLVPLPHWHWIRARIT